MIEQALSLLSLCLVRIVSFKNCAVLAQYFGSGYGLPLCRLRVDIRASITAVDVAYPTLLAVAIAIAAYAGLSIIDTASFVCIVPDSE